MNSIETYNFIDIFIVGTLLITFVLGTWKGFVRSLTSLASLVLGTAAAFKYYPVVQPYLKKVSSLDPNISMILSVIIVFIGVQVVFIVVRRILAKLLDLTRLTWLDRIFGAVMGVAAGFLVVAAAVQGLLIGIPDWPMIKTSRLVQPVDRLTWKGLEYAPKEARDQVQSVITKWKGIQEVAPAAPQRQAAPSQKATTPPPGIVK
ncbi:MAG TPA: CvpA family protein [Desulfomonilaceae bacterium]|nr:CvpA family protein [Desulfomonilaceae bacterium]